MTTEIQKKASVSDRFTAMVTREFASMTGDTLKFDANKKRLAQHLFIYADAQLKALEINRGYIKSKKDDPVISWENINMNKFALDAVHRIELGLDALIQNHIFVIPYLNKKSNKYDVDLRIGYTGKDYYKRKYALNPPKDIIYEMVYANDKFTVIKKDFKNTVESYTLEVPKPFDRGEFVGGFGYLVYEDETFNRLIIITKEEINRAKSKAATMKFWEGVIDEKDPWKNSPSFEDRMIYKTIVNIVTHDRNLPADPAKVSESYFKVEQKERIDTGEIEGTFEVIDTETTEGSGIDSAKKYAMDHADEIDPKKNNQETKPETNRAKEEQTHDVQKTKLESDSDGDDIPDYAK